MAVGYFGKCLQVGHFHLGIGDDLEEYAGGTVVDGLLHLSHVGEVAQSGFHAKTGEGLSEQRESVAKEVLRRDDVLSLCCQGYYRIADGGHTGIEGHNIFGAGQGLHALLKVGDGGVLHTRIVGSVNAAAEGVAHHFGIVEFVGHGVIDGHTDCIVSVAALKRHMNCLRLLFHFNVSIYIISHPNHVF